MSTQTIPALVLRRTYDAPRELVYQAWTDPQLAKEFLCPEEVTIPDAAFDVRVGGAYHITMNTKNGPMTVRGVYREVRKAERLVMTWQWDEDDPKDMHETLLTIEFNVHGSGTELILTHENLASIESRDNHTHGWNSILDKLASLK